MQPGRQACRCPRRPRSRTRRVTAPGASSHAVSASATRLVGIGAIGDERLGDRDRRRPVAGADDLGVAGQRRHGRERRPPRTRYATSSSSGFNPGCSRRYALTRTASSRTTEVFDWSAPRSRSVARADGGGHRPARPTHERCRDGPRPAGRAPPRSRPRSASDRQRGDRPSVGHGRRQRAPRPVTGLGRPQRFPGERQQVSGAGSRSRAPRLDRRRARPRPDVAVARTCGAAASSTKASSSSMVSIARPLSPYQRAASRAARSRPRRATSTASRSGPAGRPIPVRRRPRSAPGISGGHLPELIITCLTNV